MRQLDQSQERTRELLEKGWSFRKIAQEQGIPRNTVASRSYRLAGKVPVRRPKKRAA